jgi:hypothetical protein
MEADQRSLRAYQGHLQLTQQVCTRYVPNMYKVKVVAVCCSVPSGARNNFQGCMSTRFFSTLQIAKA